MSNPARPRPRSIGTALIALLSALILVGASGLTVSATGVKQYSAAWVAGSGTVSNRTIPGGTSSVVVRIKNHSSSVSMGSANITVPSAYTLNSGSLSAGPGTATKSGNVLQLRNLARGPGASVDVTINVTTTCGDSVNRTWSLAVKSGGGFSGDTLNIKPGTVAPVTSVRDCFLRFANQPDTTLTGDEITDGFNSTGDPLKVEIFDLPTGQVVIVNATVTLSIVLPNLPGGALSNGSVGATSGVAMFPGLSIDTAGSYKLKAGSPVAVNEPKTVARFMVSDTVDTCEGSSCSFTETQPLTSYTTTPKQGTDGAEWATTLNLTSLKISCDFDAVQLPG